MDSGMREAESMTEIWALERRNERKTEILCGTRRLDTCGQVTRVKRFLRWQMLGLGEKVGQKEGLSEVYPADNELSHIQRVRPCLKRLAAIITVPLIHVNSLR